MVFLEQIVPPLFFFNLSFIDLLNYYKIKCEYELLWVGTNGKEMQQ